MVVKKGGLTIFIREIEEVLYTNPAVMEAVVFGLPDTVIGEISCACVKLKPNYVVDEKALIDYIKPRVQHFNVPDKLFILNEFPMTASGKIRRMVLQNQLRESLSTELG
jgi:fatty-acyl-CoA synthase